MRIGYRDWYEILCMMSIPLLLIMIGPWSVRNSLKSLGEILGSCFSGRDVIP